MAKKKVSEFRARMDSRVKQQLEEIRLHHFRGGRIEMNMTRIVEDLISREHRKLKIE